MALKKYKLRENGWIKDTETQAEIPPNPDNLDYQEYLKWVDEGNTPSPLQTASERTIATDAQKRNLKETIISLTLKKGVATDENYTDIADECDTEITKLKSELAKL